MNSLRASLAAIAIAVVGLAGAGTAAAKPLPVKPLIHLCKPHYESHSQYLGIKKIGFKYYRVYRITVVYVNILCKKHVVRVHYKYVPLPWFFRQAPGV